MMIAGLKAALDHIYLMPLGQVRRLHARTLSPTVKRACTMRMEDPEAFEEILRIVFPARAMCGITQKVVEAFTNGWRTDRDVATQLELPVRTVQHGRSNAVRRGYVTKMLRRHRVGHKMEHHAEL